MSNRDIYLDSALAYLRKYYEASDTVGDNTGDLAGVINNVKGFLDSGHAIKCEVLANHIDGNEYGADTSYIIRFHMKASVGDE